MAQKSLFLIVIFLVVSCSKPRKGDEEAAGLPPIQVPPSYLSFRVNFAVTELEDGVNSVLPTILMDNAIPMKDHRDTLYLKVKRKGKLRLAVRNKQVFASIPLEIVAGIKKQVLGITFSNLDTPVTFSGIVKASADIDIADDWSIDVNCQWRGFEWTETPSFSVMGFTLDLEKTIDKEISKHSDGLADLICQSLRKSIDFRSTVEKIWMDVQDPQRIARNPRPLWLYTTPVALNGVLIPVARDTLSIHLEYRTAIHIIPEKETVREKIPLSKKGEPLNTRSALLAYPEVIIPYSIIEETIRKELKDKPFSYQGYTASITDVSVRRDGQDLELKLKTTGDLNGTVIVRGKPMLTEEKELTIEDFTYEIDAKDDWVKMTDWAIHQFAEEYIADQIKVDASPFFDQLDDIIMEGLSRSPLAGKMDLFIHFRDITSYEMRLDKEAIQWIFYLEGTSSLHLKRAVFTRERL